MKNNNKIFFKRFITPCLSVAIMLSGYALAAPGGKEDMATQAELDAEIAARQQADTSLQSADTAEATARQNADATELAARQAADTALQLNLSNAIAAQASADGDQNAMIQALQSGINQVQSDIAELKALVAQYHPAPTTYQIGDYFGGGVVFYVDETGQHGLIAALADLAVGAVPWYDAYFRTVGAGGDGIGAGANNTLLIVAAQTADDPTAIIAAKAAADFSIQEDGVTPCTGAANEICYGDWYLPSIYELHLLAQQKEVVGGFVENYYYWSSTEYVRLDTVGSSGAWTQPFGASGFPSGNPTTSGKGNNYLARAIRIF